MEEFTERELWKEMNRSFNIRKIWFMLADALIVVLSSLVSNAVVSWYGIARYGETMHVAVQPLRILIVMALEVLFCFFMLFEIGRASCRERV